MNTSILIAAPVERVWAAFMDTGRWTTLFGGVLVDVDPSIPWQAGSKRLLKVRPFKSAPASPVEIQIQKAEANHLRWTSRAPGLAATRFFTVEPAPAGTLFRNCEHVSGFITKLVPGFATRALSRTHEGFNAAFRDAVER